MPTKKGYKLKVAISMLVIFTVILMTLINWYISFASLRKALTENYLENNFHYTVKVASSTSNLFKNMKENLNTLSILHGSEELGESDFYLWGDASRHYFNTIFTTDENGIVQFIGPFDIAQTSPIKPGTKITTDLMKKALAEKKPFISEPYSAQSGNLMILLSYPVFSPSGEYKGVVDGTIYLEQNSSLKKTLNQHQLSNDSIVFVVDRSGRIIYHEDVHLINQSFVDQPDVQKVMAGKDGFAEISDKNGTKFFSGYAFVEETGWGIIARTPVSVIVEPLQELTLKMIVRSVPILLLLLLLAGIFTNRLLKPINTLARFSEEVVQTDNKLHSFKRLHINSSFYEVQQLYQQLYKHFLHLDKQLQQDGLTGILNRRAFDQKLAELFAKKASFSLIILDIDHFKNVNDEFGHLIGDDVLRFFASLLMDKAEEETFCYRYGGEEFAILSLEKDIKKTVAIAESIRSTLEKTSSPTGKNITISIGISSFQERDRVPEDVIKRADKALYYSKQNGRNKTTVYECHFIEIENAL